MRYTRQHSTNQVIIIKYDKLFVYINSGRKPATADRTSTSVNRTGEDSLEDAALLAGDLERQRPVAAVAGRRFPWGLHRRCSFYGLNKKGVSASRRRTSYSEPFTRDRETERKAWRKRNGSRRKTSRHSILKLRLRRTNLHRLPRFSTHWLVCCWIWRPSGRRALTGTRQDE